MANLPELQGYADGSWATAGSLIVHVRALDAASTDLLTLAPEPSGLLTWLGAQQQVVGWGEAARIEVQGDHAIREASAQWNALVAGAHVTNDSPYEWANRAPFALGSFGFAADTPGFLITPAVALVRRGDEAVVVTTTASRNDSAPVATFTSTSPVPVSKPGAMFTKPGRMTQSQWRTAVSELIASLNEGAASKVVLARDIVVSSDTPIDERFLASRLRQLYPSTWVFAVNGLIGATPEMLAALDSGIVTSSSSRRNRRPDRRSGPFLLNEESDGTPLCGRIRSAGPRPARREPRRSHRTFPTPTPECCSFGNRSNRSRTGGERSRHRWRTASHRSRVWNSN